MPSFKIDIKAKLVRQGLEDLARDIPLVGQERIYRRFSRIKSRMSVVPAKPRRPITWDSKKQRMAFFASEGFGGGIPYQRKGRTEKAWMLQKIEDGYRLANEEESAYFVYGDLYKRKSQSAIHAGTWPETKVVAFEELDQLPEEIQAGIEAAKKSAGF